jgi:uncharacterized protein
MFELPIFPLNTVLFPGMPLSLHIFEERYKEMISYCLESKSPFGVTLIRNGQEALGPLAEPHEVGCAAQIIDVEPLDGGRMNISALGQSRFRILSLKHDKPFLVGLVETFPLGDQQAPALQSSSLRLRPMVERYMKILTDVWDVSLDPHELPREPLVLAYLAAVLIQVPADQKQTLLSSERAIDLLTEVNAMFRREVALLDAISTTEKPSLEHSFSLN